jgi:hypothetical protein
VAEYFDPTANLSTSNLKLQNSFFDATENELSVKASDHILQVQDVNSVLPKIPPPMNILIMVVGTRYFYFY